jgi:hypothetical protein
LSATGTPWNGPRQWPPAISLGLVRGLSRNLGRHRDIGEELLVELVDPVEVGVGHFDRRDFLGAQLVRKRRDVEAQKFIEFAHRSPLHGSRL